MSVPWEVVASFIGLVIFICGAMLGVIKLLLTSYQREINRHMDQRFGSLENAVNSHKSEVDSVRDELKDFKAYAAKEFIDRDTFIRVEGGRDVSQRITNEKLEYITEMIHALRTQP